LITKCTPGFAFELKSVFANQGAITTVISRVTFPASTSNLIGWGRTCFYACGCASAVDAVVANSIVIYFDVPGRALQLARFAVGNFGAAFVIASFRSF
jgi:hypothetical protein